MKAHLCETIRVERSLEDCFRYLRDFSTIEQWDPGVYRAEKLTPGPVDVGTEFLLQLKLGGQRVPMRYTLTEVEMNRRLVLVGDNDRLAAFDELTFQALNEHSTEISYRATLTLKHLPQLAKPMLMPTLRRVGRNAVNGLATALTLPSSAPQKSLKTCVKDRLILPGAWSFTERGYLALPNKGLSQFMDGKRVLITGPTAGLGLAAAGELCRLGAHVILVGRDQTRLDIARARILDFSGAPEHRIEVHEAELSLLSHVRRVAATICARHDSLDVLINNAGVLLSKRQVTREGHETSLAVNFLAPVLLMQKLRPLLAKAEGRVINVASGGMYLAGLKLDDMEFERGDYDGAAAYARAKRALVNVTGQFNMEWRADGIDCHAMHPGWAATPGVAKSLPAFNEKLSAVLRDARMGADTMVWLASALELKGAGGAFWFDRRPHTTQVLPKTGVSPKQALALRRWLAQQLGETSPDSGELAYP